MMKRTLTIAAMILTGLIARTQAEVVLSDDFTVTGGANADINAELGGGRNTGTLTTTYSSTGATVISPVVDIDDFFNSGGNGRLSGSFTNSATIALNMDTNFGSKLAGQAWELEYSNHVVPSGTFDNGWSGFTITSDPLALAPFGELGILMRPSGVGGKQWVVFTNAAVATAGSLTYTPFDEAIINVNVTVNEPAGTATIFLDAYDPITTNFLGTQALGSFDIAFANGDRYINYRVIADAVSAPDATDAYFDDIRIETIPIPATPEYLFFDSFDTADSADFNSGLIPRQSNGVVTTSYTLDSDHYAIEGNRAKIRRGAGSFETAANLNDIVGENFEFGFTLDLDVTTGDWTSLFLVSANEPGRGQSRIGMYCPGTASGNAFILYHGTGAAGVDGDIMVIPMIHMENVMGSPYDKTIEHDILFISSAGAGGTNLYDFVVDGFTIASSLEYAFSEDTVRKIRSINILPADLSQTAFYDDVFINVIEGLTYDDWADDEGLVGSDRDRDADLEPDGMDNLLEYALGADPNVIDADTYMPILTAPVDVGGTNYLGYIHRKRDDATLRGLVYGIEYTLGLSPISWIDAGAGFVSGTAPNGPGFETVTNDIPVLVDDAEWRLKVIEN